MQVSVDATSRDLARTAAWLSKQVEIALTTVELSPPQYRVLSFLDEGSAESSALARRLAVRPPSVTAVMDGLVSKGLVERHHSPDDRRRMRHLLTDEGRSVLDHADAAVGDRLRLIVGSLDDDERAGRAISGLITWRQAMLAHRLGMSPQ